MTAGGTHDAKDVTHLKTVAKGVQSNSQSKNQKLKLGAMNLSAKNTKKYALTGTSIVFNLIFVEFLSGVSNLFWKRACHLVPNLSILNCAHLIELLELRNMHQNLPIVEDFLQIAPDAKKT